ncbi:MAG: metal-dependent hydrolase [Chloroflexi bacterium]|nr:metal-dependent hydrolase [Chloroflexota bacterium]
MPQAGIHGIVGMTVRRWTPTRTYLALGIVLGNMLPDADNFAVAVATLTGSPTEGLHRTFSHSLFTIAALIAIFYLVAALARRPHWGNLGLGLGIGMLMHALLDLVLWFNGVALFWPLPIWVNLWGNVTPPAWWQTLMVPAESLFFALFFAQLYSVARRQGTDADYLPRLRFWIIVHSVFFLLFTVLAYVLTKGFTTIYGAIYLFSLILAFTVTVRMRATVEMAG